MVDKFFKRLNLRMSGLWMKMAKGTLGSKIETLIGTDENRLFIETNLDKVESHDQNMMCLHFIAVM